LERTASPLLTAENYATKSPLVTMGCPKAAPYPSTISTPSNTSILRPTQFTTPNGTQIQSAVFPQFTHLTDRETGTWD